MTGSYLSESDKFTATLLPHKIATFPLPLIRYIHPLLPPAKTRSPSRLGLANFISLSPGDVYTSLCAESCTNAVEQTGPSDDVTS